MGETLLELKELQVSYQTYRGKLQAVRDVSLVIPKGKTVAIVGESGCGKSVTAKAVMGLIEKPGEVKKESQIIYEGNDISGYTKNEWESFRGKECSMIFQDALVALNPTLTIGSQIVENIENHFDNLKNAEKKKRAEEMLELTGISDPAMCMKKYPHELSGGMRQRVMIAMALITHPKLLIADEPTTALDVTIQAQILELMQELQKQMNMSIILITHDLGIVADIADEIVVMYAGKVIEKGNSEEIFYELKHPYTWSLLNSVPRIDMNREEKLMTIEGGLPDMIQTPEGCAFCERCPFAMNVCTKYEPSMKKISETHEAACWLLDERADSSDVPFLGKGGVIIGE